MIEKVYLPEGIYIGVDYELFWRLNPNKLNAFIEAYRKKLEEKQQHINLQAWLNGMYNAHAISACLSDKHSYPQKPIDLSGEEDTADTDSKLFEAYAIRFNREFGRG